MTDGEKLRELRKEKGYTQKALAISLGVSQMSISIAENKDHRAQEFLIALEGLEGLEPLKNESQKRSHRPLDISLDNRVSVRYWLENGKLMSSRQACEMCRDGSGLSITEGGNTIQLAAYSGRKCRGLRYEFLEGENG